MSRVDFIELHDLIAVVDPLLPRPYRVLLDLTAYASSQYVVYSETGIKAVHHCRGVEEICVSSAGQKP